MTPRGVVGQEGCVFGEGTGNFFRTTVPGGGSISYVSTPHFLCDDDVEIWADSAVAYSELGMSHLMGSVRYLDGTRELRSDTARYFTRQGRLQATGNVFIRDETDGSQIEDGDLVYLRQTDFREVETMTVTTGADGVRPRALVVPAVSDSAGPDASPPKPYSVVGDRIVLRGSSYFAASGTVEIEQDSLLAFADSAEYDREADRLLLAGSARVLSNETELVGQTITVGTPGADSSRIRATKEAVLTGDGLLLTSPEILVFLTDGDLERLVAMPISAAEGGAAADSIDVVNPIAILDNAELTADSLEIIAPNATVERVVAVGNARSVSTARDSLNTDALPEVARTDWLEGDTVIVTFRPSGDDAEAEPEASPEAGEASGNYEIEMVVARGTASALYRLPSSDSTATVGVDLPALHYVVGDEITIAWADGNVDQMRVVGQTRGVHLEPLPRRPQADSVTASPDSAIAAPDTSAVQPDTTGVGAHARLTPAGRDRTEAPHSEPTPRKEEPWTRE